MRGHEDAGGSDENRRHERGAVIMEFVVVLPVLAILIFAAIEFGAAFLRAQAIEAAAREGARLASLSTTSVADVQGRVNASLNGIVAGAGTSVSPSPCAGRQGQTVTVVVTGTDSIDIPFMAPMTVNLSGTAVFRCEA